MERVAVAAFMLLITQFLFWYVEGLVHGHRERARDRAPCRRHHPLDNDAARHPDTIQQRPSIRRTSHVFTNKYIELSLTQ